MRKPRIVSLLPATTEIVCALRLEKRLVGRSHECDYPGSITNRPICSRARLDDRKPPETIHAEVARSIEQALSIFSIDLETLQRCRPTHILTQDLCSVCAVPMDVVNQALNELNSRQVTVVSVHPGNLEQVMASIHAIGAALEVPFRAEDLVARMQARFNAVYARSHELKTIPKVACLEWTDPLIAAGHWTPELVAMAGGYPLLGTVGKNAPTITMDDLAQADPDVLIIMPCGFSIQRACEEAAKLAKNPAWTNLKAVRTGRVYAVDGNTYFNRPGPRLADSLEIMAEILHPEDFQFGFSKKAWQKL
ncbi:cobalamin-binding protein [Acanthopleuribacter pedis]|uniref:Cobalamin-binding protein n=1 Tax=Acanthopleuribacter pedis TaxID=442870 RepID=A0A8J7Q8I1_9BACT|nr:cobalamin-binding protein [Acanthopleuribacter pedis]MBO1319662.1 cobalamin-binding protein [Acanthopleuribacter pedis]